MHEPRVIVALDYPAAAPALALVDRLEPGRCRLKVGKELFTRCGPDLVGQLVGRGFEVFLDLKFHDIPNTVARACAAAAQLGVWMVNVHASGGRRMMEAAREALESAAHRPLLVAVTVLTSLSEAELHEIGFAGTPADNVRRLAALAAQAGLDGVVCSPREVAMLREAQGPDFRLVTPGIRPAGADRADQSRIMTPGEALAAGSTDLVIGRPITAADEPMSALAAIDAEIQAASAAPPAS